MKNLIEGAEKQKTIKIKLQLHQDKQKNNTQFYLKTVVSDFGIQLQ